MELVLGDLKAGTEVGADTQQTCLEVGCGSGAVSLSLLKSLPQVRTVYVAFVALFLLYVWRFMRFRIWCKRLPHAMKADADRPEICCSALSHCPILIPKIWGVSLKLLRNWSLNPV